MSLSPGSKLGSYEVLAPLGAGGMGEVYRARDTRLRRDVAIKVLPAEQLADESRRRRFVHEARAASALNHPNIVTIHEIESANGIDFIVMEYVPGKTLEALIRPGLSLGDALKLAMPIAEALARAHAAGIVHRDLKPSNVVVSDEGLVKVLDFGLAKLVGDGEPSPEAETASAVEALSLSRPGTIAGTPGYMSPEQVTGGKVDARSDVFAFGALLYEMTTGRRAFARPSAPETLAAVLHEEPQPPSVVVPGLPRQLEKLILRCLMKEPERRAQHMGDVKVELLEIKEELASRPVAAGPPASRRRWVGAGVVALTLGLGIALVIPLTTSYWRRHSRPIPARMERIAILPLENLSGDTTQEYFADGITEALTTELAQISTLAVVARDSVMRYKGSQKSSPEIAADLRVDRVIRGTVVHGDDSVRITTHLVDPATGRLLWTRSYVRPSRDVVTLLGEIAATIARELNVELTPGLKARLARARPVVPAANAAYLKGRFHLNRITEEGFWKSIDYFQEAIALDPTYAPAHSGLARSYQFLTQLHRPRDIVPRLRAALDKALALEPELAEPHTLLGQLELRDSNLAGAEKSHLRALELNPNDPLAHVPYAALLNRMGRHEEALRIIRRAEELDPLSPFVSANVMLRLNALGRFEESVKQAAKAVELQPDFWLTQDFLGGSYWRMGRRQDAIRAWERALTLPGVYQAWPLSALPEAYLAEGRGQDAEAALSRLKQLAKTRYVEPVVLAKGYAGLGRRTEALDVLEDGYRERDLELMRLKGLERHLGSELRYQNLVRMTSGRDQQ